MKVKLDTWKQATKQVVSELASQHQLTPFYDTIEVPFGGPEFEEAQQNMKKKNRRM